MSSSFQAVQDDQEVEWKFARTELWLSFIGDDSAVCPPFNIIPPPKYIYIWIRDWWLKKKQVVDVDITDSNLAKDAIENIETETPENEPEPENEEGQQTRQEIMTQLIRRYIVQAEKKKNEGEDGEASNDEQMKRQVDRVTLKIERQLDDVTQELTLMEKEFVRIKKEVETATSGRINHYQTFQEYVEKNNKEMDQLRVHVSDIEEKVDVLKKESTLNIENAVDHFYGFTNYTEKASAEMIDYVDLLKECTNQIKSQVDANVLKIEGIVDLRVGGVNQKVDDTFNKLSQQIKDAAAGGSD